MPTLPPSAEMPLSGNAPFFFSWLLLEFFPTFVPRDLLCSPRLQAQRTWPSLPSSTSRWPFQVTLRRCLPLERVSSLHVHVLAPCAIGSTVMSCFIPALMSPNGPAEKFENVILYCQESMEEYLKINTEHPLIKFLFVYSGRVSKCPVRSQTIVGCVGSTCVPMGHTPKDCGWCSYAKWLRDTIPRLFINFSLG